MKPVITNQTILRLLDEQGVAEKNVWRLYNLIREEQARCAHKFVPDTPYDPEDKWFSANGYCESCGADCGWWCPKSPNGQCDYDQPDGSTDYDACVYCHMPDERK